MYVSELFNLTYFFKIPLKASSFCVQYLLKGIILKSIICVIKLTAVFKEHISKAASVSESL